MGIERKQIRKRETTAGEGEGEGKYTKDWYLIESVVAEEMEGLRYGRSRVCGRQQIFLFSFFMEIKRE